MRLFWWLVNETFWRGQERDVQFGLTRSIDYLGLIEVGLLRCHQPDTGVMMILVVPCEEAAAATRRGIRPWRRCLSVSSCSFLARILGETMIALGEPLVFAT